MALKNTEDFFSLLRTRAERESNGANGYRMIRTPKAFYDSTDATTFYEYLQSNGVNPETCWSARVKDGKAYLSTPGLNMVEDEICLLFNFKSKDRDTNKLVLDTNKAHFYRMFDSKPYDQYCIGCGGFDIPVSLNQPEDTELEAAGVVSNLEIREVKSGGGAGFIKLIDVVKEYGNPDLTIALNVTDLLSRTDPKYGRSFSMRVEGYEATINLPGATGKKLTLDRISDDLVLPAPILFQMVPTDTGHYTATYQYMVDQELAAGNNSDIPF